MLFVGPPDAGKTAILSTVRIEHVISGPAINASTQLVYRQTLQTHASLQTNTSTVSLPNGKIISTADIPGHPRIRDQFRDLLPDAKAVAFVVDATTVSRNGPTVAEYIVPWSSCYDHAHLFMALTGIFTTSCIR